jgi:hypothetical protein
MLERQRRKAMKRMHLVVTVAVLLLAIGTLTMSESPAMTTVHADGGTTCSLAGVVGPGGFTINGTFLLRTGAVPVAAVGTYTIGADGSFSATATSSLGGAVSQETITGTVTLNSNCTGTIATQVFVSGQLTHTADFSVVFDNNGNEIRAVATSVVLTNGTSVPNVITVNGRRLRPDSDD